VIFELRIYDIVPSRKSDLYCRFERGALRLIDRHAIRLLDMWEPCDGRERLFSLYEFADANAREEAWRRFRADPEWMELKTRTEAQGPLLSNYQSWLVQRPDFYTGRVALGWKGGDR
jgi:hypothetical protein